MKCIRENYIQGNYDILFRKPMSEKKLLSWFEKRRQSITLNLAQNQILRVIDTVTELEKAILALSEGNMVKSRKCIERLFVAEVEIDELRRSVFTELTKGTLPIKYREDLKGLVGRLDRLADYVKDAARSVKILVEVNFVVPKEFYNLFLRMAKYLVDSITILSKSIEMLGVNSSQSLALVHKVDEAEQRIDNIHLKAKIAFIQNSDKARPPTFMVLKDLIDSMEHAADMCADTADFIRLLVAGEQ